MSNDVSGLGTSVTFLASKTFPTGFNITNYMDDSDPFGFDAVDTAGFAMGMNGNLITWSKATPTTVTLNVIPGSDDDLNLDLVAEMNRAQKGRRPIRDVITITVSYGDGSTYTLSGGKLVNYMPGKSYSSEGKGKSKPYKLVFETTLKTQPTV